MARKAGYFTTIAAESMSKCSLIDSKERAATLWLAASNLYSRGGNSLAGGGNYAWATLRASSLHALSQMDDHVAAEQGEFSHFLLYYYLYDVSFTFIHSIGCHFPLY